MQISLAELVQAVTGKTQVDCKEHKECGLQIVALHRGFVVVGRVSQIGAEVVIKDGAFIRRWGTSSGLGQLADRGPQEETVLDKFTELRVHEMGVLFRLPCEDKKWKI